jgi:hypothetical protein
MATDRLMRDPTRCKVYGPDLAIHWFTGDRVGDPCHCGAVVREPGEDGPDVAIAARPSPPGGEGES